MDLETLRVIISVVGVVFIALIWRLLHMIDRRLRRLGLRVDAELRALHIIAELEDEAPTAQRRWPRGVPRS